MEQALIKLGLEVYQVAGIIGLLIFFIVVLIMVLFTFYARRVKKQASEILEARAEVKRIQQQMTEQLQQMLDECEANCKEKDDLIVEYRRQIDVYRRNEIFLNNEIEDLLRRIKKLEKSE